MIFGAKICAPLYAFYEWFSWISNTVKLHNELIWLGLPNYTDHISLPFSSNPDCKWVFVLFLVVPYARSCQSFVSLSAMWSLTAHIMQSNTFILPFLQISISGTATRIVRKRFLKIAIRVFGGSTDTVLHSNAAHPNNKKMFLIFCWLWSLSLTFQTYCEIDSDRFWSPNSATILWLSSQLS